MTRNLFDITRATDSYKITHWKQYPPGTTSIYSYFEARKALPGVESVDCMFFGLQYFIKQYLEGVRVTEDGIAKSHARLMAHFGNGELFNSAGWMHILHKHGGKLPLSIKAVPEGTIVPIREALMTIENTCSDCYWLTNWVETVLVQLWYPCTIATHSYFCKKLILSYLEMTGDPAGLPFKLHDFGFRGVTCPEQAALGGAAHLINFKGTDTLIACDMIMDFYGFGQAYEMPGFSIPASEHSTITAWGPDHELLAFANMLKQFPSGLVACVSDSYDIHKAVNQYWGKDLKDRVLSRDGTLVVRPDSGDPVESVLSVLKGLGKAFGTTTNTKGCKLLPPQVRVIQGDGIDMGAIQSILHKMYKEHWSADNIAFGSGGGLLQKFDRDTMSFALKCSYAAGEDWEQNVFKSPSGDPEKASKTGRLKLILNNQGYSTVRSKVAGNDALREVFRNGELLINQDFSAVRAWADFVD